MTPPPDAVGYVDATLRDLAPFPWGTAVGTDDLAAAAAALSEVGARVLEALDARCARAALEARSERLVDHRAAGQVLELGADECAALARLDVLEADDAHQLAVDVQDVAVLQVVGRDHPLLSPIVLT